MMFWFGCSVGAVVIVLVLITIVAIIPREGKIAKRHLEIVEEQLRVFNGRMLEERRLACALETLVEHVTSTNSDYTAALRVIEELSKIDGVTCISTLMRLIEQRLIERGL